ncbi:glucose-6-phosphate isomerase [Anoxybacter fermentans]|uniref:Glucose-6-phosphate isomerase n=1 Tax=Anoxybacter fermentans TaxID=1323375 RepID=A0A3S9T060_9FIRM|nr:glucose-6-phosphate isomerase [Anoxybacter fermentans]AZR73919.1 glucose-6-phosphate isomerase [Anoxybacter fermentans]
MHYYQNKEWQEKMRIRLDVNNMFAAQVGEEHGLTKERIEQLSDQLKAAHEALVKARETSKLGFMELPYNQKEVVEEILAYVEENKGKFENIVVLGIGGSALGMIALQRALNPFYYNESAELRQGRPRLYVLDNVDPEWFGEFLEQVDVKKTLFNVISKSGGTAETMTQYMIIRKHLEDELGEKATDHLVFTTSKDRGNLIKIAKAEGIKTFFIPENVGGRFSVLSPVGLLPAAFVGIDICELLAGAKYMDQICQNEDIWQNPAYLNATLQYLAYQDGKTISVMLPYSSALKDFADWYAQLWAESLGKKLNREGVVVNVGPTPVKALGATDQHSQVQLYMEGPFDKVITFLEVKRFRKEVTIPEGYKEIDGLSYLGGHTMNELITVEKQATEMALTKNNRLNCTIIIPEINAFTVGQLIQLLEVQTAFAGELFNINAFDQPGVELGKNYTYGILGRKGYEQMKEEFESRSEKDTSLII